MFQAIKNATRAFNLSRGGDGNSRSVLTKLEGVSGTQIIDGMIFDEDTNIKFQELESGIKEYRQMLRVDPVVFGLVNAWKLPILRAEPRIEAASDSPEDEKIAEEVRDNFFENDNFTYGQWLRDVLRFFEFGFEVMEKQFELVNGRFRWKAWKHRRPETFSLQGWQLDDNEDLDHVHQNNVWDNKRQRYIETTIKQDAIFHIANEMEGENFQGTSVLRPCYRAYFIKDTLTRLQVIQAERGAVGVPYGTLKNSDKMDDMIAVLKSLRSHEQSYIADSENDFSLGFFGGKDFFGMNLTPIIDAQNKEMVEALSMGFLQQSKGESGVGSLAKQGEDIDLAMLMLESQANYVEEIQNGASFGLRHIRQLVDLNYGNVVKRQGFKYPKFKIAKISQDDVLLLLKAIELAKSSGFINKTTNEDETFIREKIGVPEREMKKDEERGAVPFLPAGEEEEEEEFALEEA